MLKRKLRDACVWDWCLSLYIARNLGFHLQIIRFRCFGCLGFNIGIVFACCNVHHTFNMWNFEQEILMEMWKLRYYCPFFKTCLEKFEDCICIKIDVPHSWRTWTIRWHFHSERFSTSSLLCHKREELIKKIGTTFKKRNEGGMKDEQSSVE